MKSNPNIKRSNKGETNVKHSEGETLLRKTNIFDISSAGISRRGKGSWNEFELIGASNEQEGEYVSSSRLDHASFHERVRNTHVGRMLLALS